MTNNFKKKRILTGDRPTGPLHLGHYVGSLENRAKLQNEYECFFIIADYQVLYDHLDDTKQISDNIRNIVLDWLSIGLDPHKSNFFIQSRIPQLAELTMYFSFLVTIARLRRNPTIKEEAKQVGIISEKDNISFGFLGFPISQAADILCFRAHLVPIGEDQKPHLEQTREIARTFNRLFGKVFPVPEALTGRYARLPGLDGQKMSKSRGNAIFLSDSSEIVRRKINSAITDPARIHPTDFGHPEICNIFQYHKAFNAPEYKEIKESCKKGKIGCVACKKRLDKVINTFLEPIREKRKFFAKKPSSFISKILLEGNSNTRKVAEETMQQVREAIHFDYKNLLKEK